MEDASSSLLVNKWVKCGGGAGCMQENKQSQLALLGRPWQPHKKACLLSVRVQGCWASTPLIPAKYTFQNCGNQFQVCS